MKQLTRHQSVLVSQNQTHSNDVVPAIQRLWLVIRHTKPIVLILMLLMLGVLVTNIAVLSADAPRQQLSLAPQTEKVQLAQIDSQARVAIAQHHYDAEIANHNRRAIFGGIVLALVFLALVGAFMQMRGDR